MTANPILDWQFFVYIRKSKACVSSNLGRSRRNGRFTLPRREIQNSKFKIQNWIFGLCVSFNLGRSFFGLRADNGISVKKWRLFDCFKNAKHPF